MFSLCCLVFKPLWCELQVIEHWHFASCLKNPACRHGGVVHLPEAWLAVKMACPASVHPTAEATVPSGKERKDSQGETGGDVWNEREHCAERLGYSLSLIIIQPVRVGKHSPSQVTGRWRAWPEGPKILFQDVMVLVIHIFHCLFSRF